MGRREMREHIFKLLFLREFNEAADMPEQMKLYFDNMEELAPTEQAYMEDKYNKIQEHLEEIDQLLNEKSTGWKTKRMGRVDLNILRLAVYEMKYDEDVPVKVAINEAVEIGKTFGGEILLRLLTGSWEKWQERLYEQHLFRRSGKRLH